MLLQLILSAIFGMFVAPFQSIVSKFLEKNIYWRLYKVQDVNFENDTFARETIKYRFKNIFSNINKDLDCSKPVLNYANFQATKLSELHFNNLNVLQTGNGNGPNKAIMEAWISSLNSYSTVEEVLTKAPFIDAEYLFYYYILSQLTNLPLNDKQKLHPSYSETGQFDPFKTEKISSLKKDFTYDKNEASGIDHESKIKKCLYLVNRINTASDDKTRREILQELLKENLSSNSSDLSQMFWSSFNEVVAYKDDSDKFWENYATNMANKNIHIIVDNFGIEYLYDLALGYFLYKKGGDKVKVIYHVKHLPIFVSDVIADDHLTLFQTLKELIQNSNEIDDNKEELDNARQLLETFANSNNVIIEPNYFWNTPFAFAEATKPARKSKLQLNNNDIIKPVKDILEDDNLLIVKGDLNYRRLVGDKLWNVRATTKSKTKYAKCPLLIIRSCKSSVVLDCPGAISKPEKLHGPDWKTDGRVGVILYY